MWVSGYQGTCESPWAFPAEPNIDGSFQGSPQSAEFPEFCPCVPPTLPVAHTHSASEPVINFRDRSVVFRNSEIVHPSPGLAPGFQWIQFDLKGKTG